MCHGYIVLSLQKWFYLELKKLILLSKNLNLVLFRTLFIKSLELLQSLKSILKCTFQKNNICDRLTAPFLKL